jgi:hypothetical protein
MGEELVHEEGDRDGDRDDPHERRDVQGGLQKTRRDDVDAKVFSILADENRGPGMQGHP